jgi:hypothetical protein
MDESVPSAVSQFPAVPAKRNGLIPNLSSNLTAASASNVKQKVEGERL